MICRGLSPGIHNPTGSDQSTVPIGFQQDGAFGGEMAPVGSLESLEPPSPDDYPPPESDHTGGSAYGRYAHNCPYWMGDCLDGSLKKFRLVEEFSECEYFLGMRNCKWLIFL